MIAAVPLQSLGIDFALSIISAITSVLLTGFVGAIAWYLKGEYREHKKNTAVRKWLVGDPQIEEIDDGYREQLDGRFDELRRDMEEQHAEVADEIAQVKGLLRELVHQYEQDHDGSVQKPGDDRLFRGPSSGDAESGGDD